MYMNLTSYILLMLFSDMIFFNNIVGKVKNQQVMEITFIDENDVEYTDNIDLNKLNDELHRNV